MDLYFGSADLLAAPALARAGGACKHSRIKVFPFASKALASFLEKLGC